MIRNENKNLCMTEYGGLKIFIQGWNSIAITTLMKINNFALKRFYCKKIQSCQNRQPA